MSGQSAVRAVLAALGVTPDALRAMRLIHNGCTCEGGAQRCEYCHEQQLGLRGLEPLRRLGLLVETGYEPRLSESGSTIAELLAHPEEAPV